MGLVKNFDDLKELLEILKENRVVDFKDGDFHMTVMPQDGTPDKEEKDIKYHKSPTADQVSAESYSTFRNI